MLAGLVVALAQAAEQQQQQQPEADDGVVEVEPEELEDEAAGPPEPEAPAYVSPVPAGPSLLAANFDERAEFERHWVQSLAKKEDTDDDIAKYDGKAASDIDRF